MTLTRRQFLAAVGVAGIGVAGCGSTAIGSSSTSGSSPRVHAGKGPDVGALHLKQLGTQAARAGLKG